MSIVSASDELNSISFHDLYLVEFLNVKLHTLSRKLFVFEGICVCVRACVCVLPWDFDVSLYKKYCLFFSESQVSNRWFIYIISRSK